MKNKQNKPPREWRLLNCDRNFAWSCGERTISASDILYYIMKDVKIEDAWKQMTFPSNETLSDWCQKIERRERMQNLQRELTELEEEEDIRKHGKEDY
jgi:hypothetical protein